MYYHAADEAVNPGVDAPAQLIEYTIRDLKTMTYINQKFPNSIPSDQVKTLINYDVSYVDHLLLPVAMEAKNVPVPNTSPVAREAYGWIGSDKTIDKSSSRDQGFHERQPEERSGELFPSCNGKNLRLAHLL